LANMTLSRFDAGNFRSSSSRMAARKLRRSGREDCFAAFITALIDEAYAFHLRTQPELANRFRKTRCAKEHEGLPRNGGRLPVPTLHNRFSHDRKCTHKGNPV